MRRWDVYLVRVGRWLCRLLHPWSPPCFVDTYHSDGDATARVHAARDELLKNETARAAYEAQKARIDARVAERRGDHSDGNEGGGSMGA